MTAMNRPQTSATGLRPIDGPDACLQFVIEGLILGPRACLADAACCPKIEDVERYFERKFRREEKLMEESGYPGLSPHRIEHISYLRRLHVICQHVEDGADGMAALHDLLTRWIVDHVNLFDAEFGRFLASQRGHAGVLGPKGDDIPTSSRQTPPCRGVS